MRFLFRSPSRRPAPRPVPPAATSAKAAAPPRLAPPTEQRPAPAVKRAPPGLTEQDLVSLYSVAPIRTLSCGDAIPKPGEAQPTLFVVMEGALMVTRSEQGRDLELATVGKGQCLDLPSSPATAGWAAVAREPSTVLELHPAVLDLVPPATQLALARSAAESAAKRFSALVTRHVALVSRVDEIVAYARSVDGRTRACLATPALQEIVAGIPRLPIYATDLAFQLMDEGTHADEIVASIKHNPSLAGRVLKRVNSAAYARETPISDYYHAFLLLGTNTVYQLLLETGIESVVPDTPESREIQGHCHLVSVLAREVARLAGGVPPLVACTIGLLHDVGKMAALVVAHTRPEIAELVTLLEPSVFGAAVLASWGLPERVVRVIELQLEPEFLPPDRLNADFRREAAVLHLAHVCEAWLRGQGIHSSYAGEYMAVLGLKDESALALFRDGVLPAVRKNFDALPAALRGLLAQGAAGPGLRGKPTAGVAV